MAVASAAVFIYSANKQDNTNNYEEVLSMSYDLHITKADHWVISEKNPITKDDLDKVTDLLDANKGIPFLFQSGRITLSGANERIIGLMIDIAARINARVQGDEGEFYDNIIKSYSKTAPYLLMASALDISESDIQIPDDQIRLIESLSIGDEIEHSKYGIGKIHEIMGEGTDTEFKVTFMNGKGPKRLLAYLAPIKPCKS
jgi:hypothetical protein